MTKRARSMTKIETEKYSILTRIIPCGSFLFLFFLFFFVLFLFLFPWERKKHLKKKENLSRDGAICVHRNQKINHFCVSFFVFWSEKEKEEEKEERRGKKKNKIDLFWKVEFWVCR